MKNSVFVFLFVLAVISHRAICGRKCQKCDGEEESACSKGDESIETEECDGEESRCYEITYKLKGQDGKKIKKGCCHYDGKLDCRNVMWNCANIENCESSSPNLVPRQPHMYDK
ncbi:uncharacterized protein LOC108906898 [Anoplophora glabripennis]|uniref:uncharacterized protein LOC108906898 n=1 Tax=Anoplophora glabripennis TaxID=217634 RepID=UPI0008745724|nr:uncharacterized protein LOC108906898 [Anoplophora glabripennis]